MYKCIVSWWVGITLNRINSMGCCEGFLIPDGSSIWHISIHMFFFLFSFFYYIFFPSPRFFSKLSHCYHIPWGLLYIYTQHMVHIYVNEYSIGCSYYIWFFYFFTIYNIIFVWWLTDRYRNKFLELFYLIIIQYILNE